MLEWEEWFYCDGTSPSGLRWLQDRMGGKGYKVVICSKDSVAGHKRLDGYWAVKFENKSYKCHRVIWYLNTKENPKCIDHINGDNSDNTFTNLRDVTHKDNCKNRGKFANNTSGKTGVQLFVNACGNEYWVAAWKDEHSRKRQKCFSVLKLGARQAYLKACEFRDKMIEKLGNYTERHKHARTN